MEGRFIHWREPFILSAKQFSANKDRKFKKEKMSKARGKKLMDSVK